LAATYQSPCYTRNVEFPPEELETTRLVLRRPTVEDAEAAFESYASDPKITRYLTWTAHTSPTQTREHFQQAIDAWDLRMGHRMWLIERKEDGTLLGTIGCTVHFHRAEIGFALGSAFWGEGYMPEAMKRVCQAAFEDDRIARVQALCDEENTRSSRVMEKVGMQYEGRLRQYGNHPNRSDVPRDCVMYAVVRGD
jgi:ribosomal-protein-alanine N-acetyltransferase